ncbi:MAG: hypothetical protein ACR2QF_05750, partial [Geminicoccaceae bacterium]
ELERRKKKDDGDKPDPPTTVWLGVDDTEHSYNGQGNAIHLMKTAIRDAKTAAAAKTILDQNVELIAAMPERIGKDLEFEVSKRFEDKQAKKKNGNLL